MLPMKCNNDIHYHATRAQLNTHCLKGFATYIKHCISGHIKKPVPLSIAISLAEISLFKILNYHPFY